MEYKWRLRTLLPNKNTSVAVFLLRWVDIEWGSIVWCAGVSHRVYFCASRWSVHGGPKFPMTAYIFFFNQSISLNPHQPKLNDIIFVKAEFAGVSNVMANGYISENKAGKSHLFERGWAGLGLEKKKSINWHLSGRGEGGGALKCAKRTGMCDGLSQHKAPKRSFSRLSAWTPLRLALSMRIL